MTDSNARNALIEYPINTTATVLPVVGKAVFRIKDYDIKDSDLDTIIGNMRAVARHDMFRDKDGERLSAKEEAELDLATGSLIYVSGQMSYEALLRHLKKVYGDSTFLLIEQHPDAPALDLKRLDENRIKLAWDYYIDSLIVAIKKNGHVSDTAAYNLRSELKHRFYSLVSRLYDRPIELSLEVEKVSNTEFLIAGEKINAERVSEEIKRAFRDKPIGEAITVEQHIDPDYIIGNTSILREIGPYVRGLDASTKEGQAAFEDIMIKHATRSALGLRDYLRNANTGNDENPKIAAFIQDIQEVDPSTGVISTRKYAMVPLDTPSQKHWVCDVQLSARFTFSEAQVVH